MIEILMFHRVLPKKEIEVDDAYFIRGILISTQRLEAVIQSYLRNGFIFKTIADIDYNSKQNQLALTFDDGHIDHFLHALPILEKYSVKATFYPVITYCKEQRIAPLDSYYHYVNTCIPLDKKNSWITGKQKQEFLALRVAEQEIFIENLIQKSENKVSYMTIEQLKTIKNLQHQIGGHSMYHDIYTQMSQGEIFDDVKNTKDEFAKIGIDINSYAYPNGDYNLDSILALEQNGIQTACVIKSQNLTKNINYELERRFVKENEII